MIRAADDPARLATLPLVECLVRAVRSDPPLEDINRVLADCAPPEPYTWDAEMQLVLYEGEEPVGLLAGWHCEWPDGKRFLHLTDFMLRPAWRGHARWRELGMAMVTHCRDQGLRAVTVSFKPEDPPAVVAVAQQWGFQPFKKTDGLQWLVWYLPEGA